VPYPVEHEVRVDVPYPVDRPVVQEKTITVEKLVPYPVPYPVEKITYIHRPRAMPIEAVEEITTTTTVHPPAFAASETVMVGSPTYMAAGRRSPMHGTVTEQTTFFPGGPIPAYHGLRRRSHSITEF
jgi:hypothetical protein